MCWQLQYIWGLKCVRVHGCVRVAIRFELIPFLQLAALQAFGHHTLSDGQNIYLFNASFQLEQIFQLILIAAKDSAQSFILIIDNNRITFYSILFFFYSFVVTRLFQSPTRVIVGQTGYKQASGSARLSKPLYSAASPKTLTHLK